MKRFVILTLSLMLVISAAGLSSCGRGDDGTPDSGDTSGSGGVQEPAGKTFYVSSDGDDGNPGTEELPLASFAGAAAAVRGYRAENGLPEGGIEVVFASGRYAFDRQIVFGAEDSGEKGSPVVYRAAEGAEVTLDGGVLIDPSAFVPVSEEISDRLPTDDAKSSVLEADLAAAGCYDLADRSDYSDDGAYYNINGYRQELYVDNERQSPARWPNEGYQTGYIPAVGEMSELTVPEGKAALWAQEKIRICGYPYIEWSSENIQDDIITVDAERGVITFPGLQYYQYSEEGSSRYYVYNALCELDAPGEYYWDVEAAKLYYYPDGDLTGRKLAFSQLGDDWFRFEGGSYIGFEGFTIENARSTVFWSGEEMKDATRGITVRNCVLRDLGTFAVSMYGSEITVDGCEFYNIGGTCISIESGDAKGYGYGNVTISNCLFHDWAQTYLTHSPATLVRGYGFRITHNEMYNCPHTAILYKCGESLIEYNLIHHVCLETSDAGAIYSGRRWDWSKNVLRYNVVRDMDTHAIYLDDMLGGQTVYGNLIVNVTGFAIGTSGKYNRIVNNVLIDVDEEFPITVDERGMYGNFGDEHVNYATGDMWFHIREGDYLSDIMRLAVPVNLLMLEQSGTSKKVDDPGTPAYCTAMNNIMYNTDSSKYPNVNKVVNVWNAATEASSNVQSNIRYRSDPGFADLKNGDYSLREDSKVFRDIPVFESIDFSKAGRTAD